MLGFRSRLNPVDLAVYDSMVRADQSGLGVTSDGSYTWQIINGVWSIASNKAVTSTAATSKPIAVVNPGYSDIDLSLGVSPTGNDAAYFRVVDANNWLRLKLREFTTTTTVTNFCTYTYWSRDYTCCSTGGTGCSTCATLTANYCNVCSTEQWCSANSTILPNTCGAGACVNQGTCTQACGTTTVSHFNYFLDLEKCVAGAVTQIANISLGENITVTNLRVVAVGSTIEAYATTAAGTEQLKGTYTDATNVSATKHGIGRGSSNSTSGDASSLSGFSLTLGE